jgi:hypothetical protein
VGQFEAEATLPRLIRFSFNDDLSRAAAAIVNGELALAGRDLAGACAEV